MAQFIFFTLFIIALLTGAYFKYTSSHQGISPMKILKDKSGYSTEVQSNSKGIRQSSVTMNEGLLQNRRKMDDLAQEQKKFFDTAEKQQQALKDAGKDTSDIMQEAEQRIADQKQRMQDQLNQ